MAQDDRRRRVLSDHRKVGSRFIPPFVDKLGQMGEVKWLDGPLPELLWLALLNDRYGLRRGADVGLRLAKEASAVVASDMKVWFAPASAFGALTPDQWSRVISQLRSSGDVGTLADALLPLVTLYPACPLAPLCGDRTSTAADRQRYLGDFKRILAGLFDKTTKEATLMQANAIYIAFATDLLRVAPGVSLANFPAVAEYPNTEEARRIGSSVRATINGFFGQGELQRSAWARYFWNRGLEIDRCILRSAEDEQEQA
jgi:hypothetical protein